MIDFLYWLFIDPIDNSKYKIGIEDGTYWVATFKIFGKDKECRSKKFFEFKISKCIVYSKFVLNFTLPIIFLFEVIRIIKEEII